MNVLYFVIPLAILLGLLFVGGFLLAIYHGQFDDLESKANRILFQDIPKE